MDPKQTLIDLLESIADRNMDEAHVELDMLDEWITKGGFIPEAIHAAIDALRFSE